MAKARPPTAKLNALKTAAAISQAAAMSQPGPIPPTPGPPQAIPGPSSAPPVPDMPAAPPTGAADGLGAGTGGLALHPSVKAAKIGSYEPRHSSKHR
jgi:hypothetical protein